MKKKEVFFIAFLFLMSIVCAQSPYGFKYQAVVRDNVGTLLLEKEIGLRVSIIQEKIDGNAVYTETHQAKTNQYGLINLEIGKGTIVFGNFKIIDWGASDYFVKLEIDSNGGSNYSELGVSQLMSVPYALYAQNAGNVKWNSNNNKIYYNAGNIGVGTTDPQVKMHINSTNESSLLRLESSSEQSGLQLVTNSNYNPFINFGTNGSPGSKGGIYCDVNNEQIVLRANYDNSSTYELVLQKNGNLGVGTKFPTYKLDVAGDLNFIGDLYKNGQKVNFGYWLMNSNNISFNSGKVGIGTLEPKVNLHVKNEFDNVSVRIESSSKQSGLELISNSNYNPFINFGTSGISGSKGGIYYDVTNNQIVFRANQEFSGSNEFVIQDNGNLGVGKKFPLYKLDIVGDINYTGEIYKNGQKVNFGQWSKLSNNLYYSSGNVGIGTSNISANLHVKNENDKSTIRIESTNLQSGLELISNSNYNPFINFGTSGISGSKGGIYYDVTNNQIVFRANQEYSTNYEIVLQNNGNLGVGTKFPKAKLEVTDGDVYVNNPKNGIILKSPNGQCWRVTIDNNGDFQKTAIICP